jgi:hypothetical protein
MKQHPDAALRTTWCGRLEGVRRVTWPSPGFPAWSLGGRTNRNNVITIVIASGISCVVIIALHSPPGLVAQQTGVHQGWWHSAFPDHARVGG